MGNVETITADTFPTQGSYLGRRVEVSFHHDTTRSKCAQGTIVRDDTEEPWPTIIRLDDGRYVLGSECQYTKQ